jgi:1,4-dihydroxy-6-naphthoate synthase
VTTIRVAHSPDSDDAFMFYALAEGLIDTGEIAFEHILDDIETLNREAVSSPSSRLNPMYDARS